MKKAILFDLDGTLIDSTEPIITGFGEAFTSFGMRAPDRAKLCSLIGHTLDDMFATLGAPQERVADFIKAYKESYAKNYLAGTTLLKGAKESLELASKKAKLAVVTTKTSKYSRILLEHLGVAEFFSAIIGKDDVTNAKPHPEPILKALKALEFESLENAFMIGDTIMDANAAKSAGIHAFGVLCGYGSKESLEGVCEAVFADTLQAVKQVIK